MRLRLWEEICRRFRNSEFIRLRLNKTIHHNLWSSRPCLDGLLQRDSGSVKDERMWSDLGMELFRISLFQSRFVALPGDFNRKKLAVEWRINGFQGSMHQAIDCFC